MIVAILGKICFKHTWISTVVIFHVLFDYLLNNIQR